MWKVKEKVGNFKPDVSYVIFLINTDKYYRLVSTYFKVLNVKGILWRRIIMERLKLIKQIKPVSIVIDRYGPENDN